DAVIHAIEHHGDALAFDRLPAHVAKALGVRIVELANAGARAEVLRLATNRAATRWLLAKGGVGVARSLGRMLRALDAPDHDPSLSAWETLARSLIAASPSLTDVVPDGATPVAFVRLCHLVAAERPELEPELLEVR